jgi:hypothetical protein
LNTSPASQSSRGRGKALTANPTTAGSNCAVKAVDEATRQKWLRVKAALEAAGKTDCHYYRLAVAALANV